MKVPIGWLKDYLDIDVSPKELAEALTMTGSKVEGIETRGEGIQGVVVGKVLEVSPHPNADKLVVTKVDVGDEVVQVVTGATNMKAGDFVPVALHGSTLPGGVKITKCKLRGVESNGMMCSLEELALSKEDYPDAEEDGIFIIDPAAEGLKPGQDIREAMGLNETVLDLEITSNRPDCLSILGIAREAGAALGRKLKKPDIRLAEEGDDIRNYASVELEAPDLCPRYAARVVTDVRIGPSPKWMADRLKAAGVRSINNIVDITNYVMLELGQPMHAFDLDSLDRRKIVVRRAARGESIMTLDGQERLLDQTMLVIADGARPVAVAGVMGGEGSGISDSTRTILLESANFNGISVRLTAKKIGLRTEASSRFEKGLDVENVITALDRAAQLIEELGAGKVCKGIIDCFPAKPEKRTIKLMPEKINSLLGTSIESAEMLRIFKSLEFEVDEEKLLLGIPSFRPDIEREADLAEEVARFYGYNSIRPTLMSGTTPTIGRKTPKQKIEDMIKAAAVSCGFSEIYTYSFTSPRVFDRLRIPEGSEMRKTVTILNPLGEDCSIMRTTTVPEMLKVISTNYSRMVEKARLFEYSFVYLPSGEGEDRLPYEKPVLTLGMYGDGDFYDLKGVVEEILELLKIDGFSFEPETDNPIFHPGRTAALWIRGEKTGTLGEIHQEVAENFQCPERTYAAVIDVEPLIREARMESEYRPLPRFPAVTRDIAILVEDRILVRDIERVIREKAGKYLENMSLFDIYRGKQIPEGMKSVAYSISFRAPDRTLTDEEVNRSMGDIINSLKASFSARLRE